MSISTSENKSIIKPSYTSNDVKRIYNGIELGKGCDWRNPSYKVLLKITFVMVLIWIFYLGLTIYSGLFEKYINWIENSSNRIMNSILPNIINEYICLPKNSTGLSIIIGIIAFLGILFIYIFVHVLWLCPFIIFPIMIISKSYKKLKKGFIKKGLIQIPPISYDDYMHFFTLYRKAEILIRYLEGSDIVDLFIENENTVRVIIHNSLISKEEKYVFDGMVREIFTPTKIDFSIIDKQFDLVRKGNSDNENERS